MPNIPETLSRELAAASPEQREQIIEEAVKTLPDERKTAIAVALQRWIPNPGPETANKLWLVIIWALAIALVAAVSVLCVGVFKKPIQGGVEPDKVLTIFTTITAFLAGLFSPSPTSNKKPN